MIQKNIFTKQKQTQTSKSNLQLLKGNVGKELGINIYILLKYKIDNKDLVYSTEKFTQYIVIT